MPIESSNLNPHTARAHAVATIDGHPVSCRPFISLDDTEACVALQREVWGDDFDLVPATLLQAILHIGGLAIGAFHDDGAMLGFVFSLPGTWHGELIHWSHMLAVRESARDMGIGRALKELQRLELARRGIARMMWTFDPLQARNAHLNLNRLAVRVVDYVENMYGITRSPLHHGLATDRLIVSCTTSIGDDDPPIDHRGNHDHALPVLTPFPHAGDATADGSGNPPAAILVEIPPDFNQVVARSPDTAAMWRNATRRSFLTALRDGYRVTALLRDAGGSRAFYRLQLVPSTLGGLSLDRHEPAFVTPTAVSSSSGTDSPLPPPLPQPPHHRSDV